MLEGKDIKEGKEGSGAVRARRRVEDDGAETWSMVARKVTAFNNLLNGIRMD